jgi:hypothetical protein
VTLQKQPYALQFAGGLDTRTDTKQVGYAKLLDLQNAVFTKNTTLVKRNGYHAHGRTVEAYTDASGSAVPPAPYTDPQGLGVRDSELVLFANAHAHSYRPSTDTWQRIGPVQAVPATSQPIARTGTHQTVPDVATNGGVSVVAWEDSRGGVWCSVVEGVDRILLPALQLDASGKMPRCLAVGSVLHVLWVNGTHIWCAIVNPATPASTPAAATLVDDLDGTNQFYDAVATFGDFDRIVTLNGATYDSTGRPGLIAYATPGGIKVGYIHQSGVLGSPATALPTVGTIATASPAGAMAVDFFSSQTNAGDPQIAVVCADATPGTNLTYYAQDGYALGGGAAVVLAAGAWQRCTAAFDTSATVWWACEGLGSGDASTNFVGVGKVVGSTVTVVTQVRGHALASRAFLDGNDVYAAIVHPVLYFPYVAVCQLSGSMRAQARLLPGLSAGILSRALLPSVVPSGREHTLALGYRIQLTGTSGTQFGEQGIQLFTLDFGAAYQTVQLGRGLYLAGSLLQHYDGDRWAEADFHCAPDTASGAIVTSQTTGGALTTTSTYGYKYVYEEIDGQGEIHPGAPSVEVNVTLTGANNKVTHTIPTYRLTSKKRVRIGVFRSVANATGTPSQIEFFRVSSVDPLAAGPNGYVLNDPSLDTVTFVDAMSDAVAEDLEPLYTNGGILPNSPPAFAGNALAGGKSRIFATDPTDPHLVVYSQQLRDDTAAELAADLTMRTDPYGGRVVGLCVMDDGVFAFCETAIYVTDGPGPDADGGATSQNAFTPWALVTSDVGCKAPGSICQTPNGIVFQSQKGIKLLGRDRQVVDIGSDVYAYNAQTVARATLLPDRHAVVFLTSSGSTLYWDYLRGQWSRFTNHEGIDAVIVGGTYCYLRNDGRVFAETPGVYADDNLHIPMVIETAWVKFAGYLQGMAEGAPGRRARGVQVKPSVADPLSNRLPRGVYFAHADRCGLAIHTLVVRSRALRRGRVWRDGWAEYGVRRERSHQSPLHGYQFPVLRHRTDCVFRRRVRTLGTLANGRNDRDAIPDGSE